MLKYIKDDNKYQHHDVTVNLGAGHVYSQEGHLKFRVWTNLDKIIRRHAYSTVVLTPSYRVTEQQTVQGVAKAAVIDLARLVDTGVCKEGEILILNADGTHKDKSPKSTTGPWFLDAQNDPEITSLVEKYNIDFATVVTEDSGIFSSIPGETDVRGKGSQYESSFNFIRHFAMTKDNCYVMCVDSDLKGTDGFVYRMCLGLNEGYSYLLPHYWRYKYEGRATNHLMYPLYAAITRRVVRQPIGGEFGFNAKMLTRFTEVERWVKGWRDFGIDMGMTVTAGTSGEAIGQVVLPRKINYVGQDARNQIGDIFVQEGRSLFNGLLNHIESHKWEAKHVVPAPIFEIETFNNNNLKIELNDRKEVIGALSKFLYLYKNTSFQNDGKSVLGNLYERVRSIFEKINSHDLGSVSKLSNHKANDEEQQSEIINKILSLDNAVFLTAKEWAEIVFQCFKEFQVRRKKNEEKASKVVIRCALLCVFYLRVFSFNVQALNLPSYPDAEALLKHQMHEFLNVAQVRLL